LNENPNIKIEDCLSFKDNSDIKHGLRGHVKIVLENVDTKEKKFWYEDDNIIPISGYQWILMKMFGLHLDSVHDPRVNYEDMGQDTSIVIPDLNNDDQLRIGRNPNGEYDPTNNVFKGYTPIEEDIPSNHFIQGFMVGNGGAGEDAITTKNTDYSFIKLRNPIPFQQTTGSEGLDPSISGKYLGVYRQPGKDEKNYFIKKFDERPHIYHNWWRDGQRWDYLDPVRQSELGPDGNGTAKTNRIETYAQVEMSIDTMNSDCFGYFQHAGNGETAVINELGLVAFDTVPGERSTIEMLYNSRIKRVINLIFDNNRPATAGDELVALSKDIAECLTAIMDKVGVTQGNINKFIRLMSVLSSTDPASIDYEEYQKALTSVDNDGVPTSIGVEAFYNHNGSFVYATDRFLEYLNSSEFGSLTTDEAQRIKLITYYTFNSIPLQANWKVLISYRIYAN